VHSSLPAFWLRCESYGRPFFFCLPVLASPHPSAPPPPAPKQSNVLQNNEQQKKVPLLFLLSLVPFNKADQYCLHACYTTFICFLVFIPLCSNYWEISDYFYLHIMTLCRRHRFTESQMGRSKKWVESLMKLSWHNLGCVNTCLDGMRTETLRRQPRGQESHPGFSDITSPKHTNTALG
jgi:hypothetical protein